MPTERHVAYTRCTLNGVVHVVSTVDLRFPGCIPYAYPYETMLFYGDANGDLSSMQDHYCQSYETAEEAAEGHQEVVSAMLRGTLAVY